MTIRPIAEGVYAESEFLGVTVGAVVTGRGIVCIDSPTQPADARKWRLRLAQLSERPVQYVVNLDHLRDRVIGNQWFEAPAVAHEAAVERIRSYPEQFRVSLSEMGADADLVTDLAGVSLVPPQVTFSKELILHKGNAEIHVEHQGGSSPGASRVHLPAAKVMFLGELFTVGVPPFLGEADTDAWLERLDELKKARYRDYVFVPGRGPAASQAELKEFASFLNTVRRKVRRLHTSRQPRAAVVGLVSSALGSFKVPSALRDLYARRILFGLEHLYDEAEQVKG